MHAIYRKKKGKKSKVKNSDAGENFLHMEETILFILYIVEEEDAATFSLEDW